MARKKFRVKFEYEHGAYNYFDFPIVLIENFGKLLEEVFGWVKNEENLFWTYYNKYKTEDFVGGDFIAIGLGTNQDIIQARIEDIDYRIKTRQINLKTFLELCKFIDPKIKVEILKE